MTQLSEGMAGAIHRADQGGGIPGIFVFFDVDDINQSAHRVQLVAQQHQLHVLGELGSPTANEQWPGPSATLPSRQTGFRPTMSAGGACAP